MRQGQAAEEAWLKDVGLTVCDCAQLYKCFLLSLLRANTSHCCLMFCCLFFKAMLHTVLHTICFYPHVSTPTVESHAIHYPDNQHFGTSISITISEALLCHHPVTCKTRSTKPNKICGHGSHLDCISPNGVSNGRMGKVIVTSLQTKHIKRTLFSTIVPRPAETAPLATSQRTNWLTWSNRHVITAFQYAKNLRLKDAYMILYHVPRKEPRQPETAWKQDPVANKWPNVGDFENL